MGKKKKKQISTSIPEGFKERLSMMYGQSVVSEIEKTFVERPTTFRINTIKSTREDVMDELKRNGIKAKQVVWYKDAYILENKSKRDLMGLDCYKTGGIYIQSLASMVPPVLLDPQPGEKVLDLTAAPGSKTSQIAALMQKTGQLVANDMNKVRFFKLQHNMEHLGVMAESRHPEQVQPVEGFQDAWDFTLRMEHGAGLCKEYDAYFDRILLDAPCSAEARFVEGNPKSFGYWKERKVKEMAYKQRQLLLAAWNALRPGGRLVYSTCTFAPEENEVQVQRLLDRNEDAVVESIYLKDLKALPALKEWRNKKFSEAIKETLRIMPTKEIEGFYVASISKQSS